MKGWMFGGTVIINVSWFILTLFEIIKKAK